MWVVNGLASHSISCTRHHSHGCPAQCLAIARWAVEGERPHSLDHRRPAVLQAQLQLLQDAAALLQLRCSSVGERHVVNGEAPLLVGVQQRRNPVLVQFAPSAEDKHLLHTLVQELLCPAGSAQHNGWDTEKLVDLIDYWNEVCSKKKKHCSWGFTSVLIKGGT